MQIEHNNIVWRNFAKPDLKELIFLQDELKVGPTVIKELMGFNKRPKIEEYDGYLFLVIHFPVFNEQTRQTTPTELDFIIADNLLITVYQNANPALEKVLEDLQNEISLQAEYFKNSGWLLFCILDRMIDSCLPMLDHIHEKIDNIEQQVFEGKEREMLKEIALVKRDIINFRRTIKPQRSILEVLSKKADRFFKTGLDSISQEVIGSEIRVWNTLENHKDMIEAIETTNSSLLSFQISQVMRTLTYFSIILFSLTFIAAFFNMRVEHPLLNQGGLGIISLIMLTVIIIITILFKRKRWI